MNKQVKKQLEFVAWLTANGLYNEFENAETMVKMQAVYDKLNEPKTDDNILGKKIIDSRLMTAKEMDAEGWDVDNCSPNPPVIVLENGTKLYPSRDSEGNGGGVLFGVKKNGATVIIA